MRRVQINNNDTIVRLSYDIGLMHLRPRRAKRASCLGVVEPEVEDEAPHRDVQSFLDHVLTGMIALSVAGCVQLPGAPSGGDSMAVKTELILEVPLDIALSHHEKI